MDFRENIDYANEVRLLQTSDNARDIQKAIKYLQHLHNYLQVHFPEFVESLADIDYYIACGAFRVNNVKLFESIIQQHYYDDSRFKKLYILFREMQTTNIWNNIVKTNASHLEKTFIRSLSLIIIAGVCVSIILRK